MLNKAISSILIAGLVGSGVGISALENNNHKANNVNQNKITDVANQKINNQQEAINLIQNKYLIQEANGTFSINPIAKNYISENVLNNIQKSMDFVNQNIIKNNVKFKLTKENGQVTVTPIKITNTYKNEINENISKSLTSSKVQENGFAVMLPNGWVANNMYDITYTWYGGYGFVDPGSVYSVYQMCLDNGNSSWANTALDAYNNNYDLTLTFSSIFGITNLSI